MTETMTNGEKTKKRDTTHRRIALRVAPPGLDASGRLRPAPGAARRAERRPRSG